MTDRNEPTYNALEGRISELERCVAPSQSTADDFEEKSRLIEKDHKLQVRRLWLDKVLLGAIVALVIIAGQAWLRHYENRLNLSIEKFKTDTERLLKDYEHDLSHRRFMQENRLRALQEIRTTYNDLIGHLYKQAETASERAETRAPYGKKAEYGKILIQFRESINKWSLIFREEFGLIMSHHAWFHQALQNEIISITLKCWPFVHDWADHFDRYSRYDRWRVRVETNTKPAVEDPSKKPFEISIWERDEVFRRGIKDFMRSQLDLWHKHYSLGEKCYQ